MFLIGMNYEGPSDRAWQMWNDGQFDAGLIDADFQRAASAGTRSLRIFVQASLASEVNAGKWDKLDQVVGLAEKRNVQLQISLHDYGERDLQKISAIAEKIARHYRGRAGILAYDLKNEPRFGDLALTQYGAPVPLQQTGLIQALGERLARGDVPAFRATDDGSKDIPASLSDDQAYVYENNLKIYRDFLADASAWVGGQGGGATSLDFVDDPAGQKWAPLIQAFDTTLTAWIQPQLEAVRRGDPAKPVTLDHVDALLAKLPANDALDFQALHRYPSTSASGVRAALGLVARLQAAHPGKPYVLGEFGYATQTLAPEKSAILETAVFLGLLAQHAAGGNKWMLNDMPDGYNMRERTLGAFTTTGAPKPVVGALAALQTYVRASGSEPGSFQIADDPDAGVKYVYTAADAALLGGKQVDGGVAQMAADAPGELFVTYSVPGTVRLWASTPMQATLDLEKILGAARSGNLAFARVDGDREQALPAGAPSSRMSFRLDQPGWYLLRTGAPLARPDDYDVTGGHFFTQTNGRRQEKSPSGFGVTNADGIPFWDTFQSMGGADILGYPVTRRFQMDGFTLQAFQKGVLQWRPDQGGQVWLLNTFDLLHDRGKDDWLEAYRETPRPFDTAPDAGLAWEAVVKRHLGFLDKVPAPLKAAFLADDAWMQHFGLPVATAEYPDSVVVRAQRATFQYWKVDEPWARKGDVSVANGGDLAKEAGVWPWLASTPENAPR